MSVTRIGLDLARLVFQVRGVEAPGEGRDPPYAAPGRGVHSIFAQLAPCLMVGATSDYQFWRYGAVRTLVQRIRGHRWLLVFGTPRYNVAPRHRDRQIGPGSVP